jgi:hypothetical protein
MKIKWIIFYLAAAIIIGSSITCFWLRPWKSSYPKNHLPLKGPYFVEVPITDFFSHIPYIEIEVEGMKIKGAVDLGSLKVALPKYFLDKLNQKSFLKKVSRYGIRGKKYDSDIYEIPKIKVGAASLYQIWVEEINPQFIKDASLNAKEVNPEFIKELSLNRKEKYSPDQNFANIGWGMFYLFNVFLDCENSKIVFCDSLATLKKHGYPVDSFVETPMSLDRNLIEFEVKTHKGKMLCVLDTGCTLNMLNKDLENGSNGHMIFNPDDINQQALLNPSNSDLSAFDFKNIYDIPLFKIGKKDFGKTTFAKVKIPFKVDAFVGMQFLRSKLVFIDFSNRKLYFYDKALK